MICWQIFCVRKNLKCYNLLAFADNKKKSVTHAHTEIHGEKKSEKINSLNVNYAFIHMDIFFVYCFHWVSRFLSLFVTFFSLSCLRMKIEIYKFQQKCRQTVSNPFSGLNIYRFCFFFFFFSHSLISIFSSRHSMLCRFKTNWGSGQNERTNDQMKQKIWEKN